MRRNLLFVLLCLAGSALGVYAGFLIFTKEPVPAIAQPLPGSAELSMTFGTGDAFPSEDFTDREGNTGNFESLLKDKETILFFTHFGCETCHDLLKFWKEKIQSRLHDDVQCVVCMERAGGDVPIEYAGLVDGMNVIFYDGDRWRNFYQMEFWPTIVTVDEDRMVTHVQFGFDYTIDYEIIRRYASPPGSSQ